MKLSTTIFQRCDNYDCPKRQTCWYAMVGNMFLWCPVVECVDYSAYEKIDQITEPAI
jgi:hypothetical protein